jgi:hypothetical protein
MNQFAFIIPILNDATWLQQFINHYEHILSRGNHKLIFVEGATSFHNAAEHRNGKSIDGSIDIIDVAKSYNSKQIICARQGKVHLLSELLNAGFRLAETATYICPLKPTDFIPYEVFDKIEHTNVPCLALNRVILAKDFKSRLPDTNGQLPVIKSTEGLSFKNGDWMPYFDNKPINISTALLDTFDTQQIETKNQCARRILYWVRFKQWRHNNIKPIPDYQDINIQHHTIETIDNIENGNNTIEFKGALPETLQEHPWNTKTFNEIWHYDVSFPNFSDTKRQLSKPPQQRGKILEIGLPQIFLLLMTSLI